MLPEMWQKVVNRKWIYLKDDRFLSGANWGEVRKYLPDPVAYPLTSNELAEMDTLVRDSQEVIGKRKK